MPTILLTLLVFSACTTPAARSSARRAAIERELAGDERALGAGTPDDSGYLPRSGSDAGEEWEFDEIGVGRALSHESHAAAVDRAREDALSKASMKALDIFYGFEDLDAEIAGREQAVVSRYFFTSSRGLVLDRDEEKPICEVADGVTTCRIRVRGKLSVRGPIDPSFRILDKGAGPDRRVYYEGEAVRVTAAVSKPAFLYVLSIGEDENAHVVFPNAAQPGNQVAAGRVIDLPGEASGVAFRARLPRGASSAQERLLVLAASRPLLEKESELPMRELARRLASLERREWTLRVFPYRIESRVP